MNQPAFPASVYAARRHELKRAMGSGIVLICGNELSPMNYRDNTYPFRQDSTFLYYFGLDTENLNAVIDIDEQEEIIFGDELTMDQIVWTGPLPSVRDRALQVGVRNTKPSGALPLLLQQVLNAKREIHWLPQYRDANRLRLAGWFNLAHEAIDRYASLKLIKAVIAQRSIKDAAEVAELDKAAALSADMHLEAMQHARPGMKEYELVARVEAAALAGYGRTSYPTILTVNGQTLHNHYHGNTLADGQLVLCDAGAEIVSGYCGDLTRTFPVSKRFTEVQKDIYNIVLNAFEQAVATLKPGTLFRDVHYTACVNLAKGLASIGLMKGDPAEAVAEGAHTLFFQCGTGHMIGLDVHDMEALGEEHIGYTESIKRSNQFGTRFLRLAKNLEAGFAVTVEPGIYFIPELIDQWAAEKKHASFINYQALQAFRNFGGIRVEDDYLITENGSKMLGKHLARTVDEIEALR